MRVARRYLVSGRVQGVGYRFHVDAAATREGIGGWVRNLADGRVEVMVEGDAEGVDRLEVTLWRGPGHARIDQVDREDLLPTGRYLEFTVRGSDR